jgi:Zn-dependent peptidase ImmA (M78 family)
VPMPLRPETIIAIEEAYGFVDALEELRDADPALFTPFAVPEYKLTNQPEDVAASERERLGVSIAEQFAWQTDREAFLRWREAVEAQGVFAYQLALGADDSRGFAIWDERQIPVIVIDSAEDPYPARVFTIWHEYAHVLLRMGGISNQNSRNVVERFCNQFAAYFLMPRESFTRAAHFFRADHGRWDEGVVGKLAARFKVSKSAAALHLEDAALAPEGFYGQMLALWRVRTPSSTSGGVASHIEKHANRLGTRHIDVVLSAVERGVISKLDAYEFTNVRPKWFPDLRLEVAGRRAAYGRSR